MHRMTTSAWNNATEKAADALRDDTGKTSAWGYRSLRVHNLKHTFGRRFRAAGVPIETRKVLLGHTTGGITTHYSAAEIGELVDAIERVCDNGNSLPTLTLIKAAEIASHAKSRAQKKNGLSEKHLTHC